MSEPTALMGAWSAGLGLGVLFFGGLWWTVRALVTTKRPSLLTLGSLIVRMGITLPGIYFASGGAMDRLLACLVGFLTARALVTRSTRVSVQVERGTAPPGPNAA